MKLFVDDLRPTPLGVWDLARTVAEAKQLLSTKTYDFVSLDHDMGWCQPCQDDFAAGKVGPIGNCPHVEDGTALARWMVANGKVPPNWKVHSANPDGKARMERILKGEQK